MIGKCSKQETIAIIETADGRYYIGSNWCFDAQDECPRKDMPSGVGYELCDTICQQSAHAEVDACENANDAAKGKTLYLLGHTYCCDNCKKVMAEYGIEKVVIGELPKSFSDKITIKQ